MLSSNTRSSDSIRSMLSAIVVALAWASGLSAQSARTPTVAPLDPGRMVREVSLAYEQGTELAVARQWRERLRDNDAARALLDGSLHRLAFQFADAERAYRRAAQDSTGAVGAYATAGIVTIAANRGDFVGALRDITALTTQMARTGDRAGLSEVLIAQAQLALRVVGIDSAMAVLRTAERTLPDNSPTLRVRHQCAALQVAVRRGARIADSTWRRIGADAAPLGPRLRAECLFIRAQSLTAAGNAIGALAVMDTVAEWQIGARLWNGLSVTRQWQGSALLNLWLYKKARERLSEALMYAKRSGNTNAEAWAMHELGRFAQRLGASGDAARDLAIARRLFQASGDATALALATQASADGALWQGELAIADSLYREATPLSAALAPLSRVGVLIARAEIARRQRDLTRSSALLDSAELLGKASNMGFRLTDITYHRGVEDLVRGDASRAVARLDSLLKRPNLVGPALFEVHSRLAEAFVLQGRLDDGWKAFGKGKRMLDFWGIGRLQRSDKLALLQDRVFDWDRDLGFATMVARFATAGRNAEALSMAEWRRLRNREQSALQRGALAVDTRRIVGVMVNSVDTLALDPQRFIALARARLSPREAVLSYVVGAGNEPTTAFLLTRDTLRSVTLSPIDSLASAIERFNAFLQAGRVVAPLAMELSRALVAPVLAQLPVGVTRLIVVPDGELHRLPFVALTHPSGDPLPFHLEVAIAPSVEDAMGSATRVARSARDSRAPRVLLVGAPRDMPLVSGTDRRWPALPGARAELQAISAQLDYTSRLDGRAATQEALAPRLAQGGALLHMATHAVADPTSFGRTGLIVQPSADDGGLLSTTTLSTLPLPFDLVVLSACSSGEGLLLVGQSLHGLVSTVLDAGARGVIATRWRLDDTAIVPHMQRLYDLLLEDGDVVTALHRTRVEAMQAGVSPAIWANLDYFGDPTLQVVLQARTKSAWSRFTGNVWGWLRSFGGAD